MIADQPRFGGRRRLLFVPVLFYPEPWNGIMEHLLALISRLDDKLYEPVLGTRPDDGTQTTSLANRVGIETVDLGSSRSVRQLLGVFRRERPDIVHVHTPSTSGLAALAVAARLARVPRVAVTLHQVAPDRLPLRTRLVNRCGQRLVDEMWAVSTGAASTQAERAGLRRGAIDVVPNGVEDARTSELSGHVVRSPGDIWAGYFGRLAAEKGVEVLIQAVAEVRRRGLPLCLLVVGDGYERRALEKRASLECSADAVRFMGYRPDARSLMADVDIVVHVPQFEGFGLVVAEAMAAAKPVIGSLVEGGIPDMIRHGETGFLVPSDDVGALADALERLSLDGSLRAAFGRAARIRYEESFTVDRMVERTTVRYGRPGQHRKGSLRRDYF